MRPAGRVVRKHHRISCGQHVYRAIEGIPANRTPRIKEELLNGTYKPQAVRKVEIPKPGGTRMLDRIKSKIREISRKGRGRNLKRVIEEITPILRGWSNYFKLSEVKKPFEDLDGWIRRKLRCILWRQWKRPFTRMKKLMQSGLSEARAWRSVLNKRGPW